MKKVLLILGMIVLISLLIACAPAKQTITKKTIVTEKEATVINSEPSANDDADLETETGTTSETEQPSTTASSSSSAVSQEELDQLKEEIEKMEFEDLGGLSE